jgi:RES domain-containing protein
MPRKDWRKLLAQVEPRFLQEALTRRIVAIKALRSRRPPDCLYTSGRANRYNTAGVFSLYCSEDAATAGAEFERYWDTKPRRQYLFFVQVTGTVLDLENSSTRDLLKLSERDLFRPWRTARRPTPTQQLGNAVAMLTRFIGIRYPSEAARERGFIGYNYVVFSGGDRCPGVFESS